MTIQDRLDRELARMKANGITEFSPADVARNLNLTTKEITGYLRHSGGAVLKRKAHARRFSPTTISQSVEPMYYPSLWEFRKVEA